MPCRAPLSLALLAAVGLTWAAAGCCIQRGFILRGDWSIEANRIPFMAGHAVQYERPADASGCATGDCRQGHPAAPQAGRCAAGCCRLDHACRDPKGAAATAGPARFHPVPMRPVFEPLPSGDADGPIVVPPGDDAAPAPAEAPPN